MFVTLLPNVPNMCSHTYIVYSYSYYTSLLSSLLWCLLLYFHKCELTHRAADHIYSVYCGSSASYVYITCVCVHIVQHFLSTQLSQIVLNSHFHFVWRAYMCVCVYVWMSDIRFQPCICASSFFIPSTIHSWIVSWHISVIVLSSEMRSPLLATLNRDSFDTDQTASTTIYMHSINEYPCVRMLRRMCFDCTLLSSISHSMWSSLSFLMYLHSYTTE